MTKVSVHLHSLLMVLMLGGSGLQFLVKNLPTLIFKPFCQRRGVLCVDAKNKSEILSVRAFSKIL